MADEDKLQWAISRDTLVREKMTELMRQKWPAGLALAAAIERYKDDWKPAAGLGRAGGSSQVAASSKRAPDTDAQTQGTKRGRQHEENSETIHSITTKAGTMKL